MVKYWLSLNRNLIKLVHQPMNYRKCNPQNRLSKKHVECFLTFLASRGYTITRIDDYQLLYKVEKGGFVRFLCDLDFNTAACSRLLKDKLFTYLVLEQLGIRIPTGTYFLLGDHQYSNSTEDILAVLAEVDYPIIIKPNDSSLGKGLTVLTRFSVEGISRAISNVKRYSNIMLVQKYLDGREYRVVAIEGEIVFAVEKYDIPKVPAQISLSDSEPFVDVVSTSMKHLGALVCGYDFMVTEGTVCVLEINSNPFVFQIKHHLDQAALGAYFSRLEELLRRDNGNRTQT